MEINIQNYKQARNSFDTSKLSDAVLEVFNDVDADFEDYLDLYTDASPENDGIRDVVNNHIKLVNKYLVNAPKETAVVKLEPASTNVKKTKTQVNETIEDAFLNAKYTRSIMPRLQMMSVMESGKGEEKQFFIDKIKEFETIFEAAKKRQNLKAIDSIVRAHFFYRQTHWYIFDYDPKQNYFFGYVVLNGDTQNSESGYISIDELHRIKGVELDFYWTPKELHKALHDEYPDEFDEYKSKSDIPAPKAQAKAKAPTKVTPTKVKFFKKSENNSQAKPKAPTKPQPKGTVKIKPVVEKKFVDNFSTEFQLIKRFWNIIKDKKIVVEFRKAQLLYAAFNKAAIERKVRKTSDVAEIFNDCNQKMKVLFEEFMLPTQEDVKIDFADKDLYDKIEKYVANVSINPTVAVLKRFVAIQNTLPEIKKAETLLKTLIKTKEKFKDSRLSDELSKAIKALQDYIKNPKQPIELKNYGLSKPRVVKKKVKPRPKVVPKVKAKPKAVKGPVNIAKTVVKKPAVKVVPKKPAPSLASPDVSRIDEGNIKTIGAIKAISDTGKQQNNFYKVNGAVGKFLQQVERKPFESVVITIDGMQGAGKTTTLYKFIDAFASAGNSSLFISGEEHPESALAVEKRDKYLSPEAKKHTAIVGHVDNVEQLYQYLKPYDIIFIDSWQKLQRMVGAIRLDEDLRKKFNGKVFVVIFQQTTTGRTKGGAEVVFDGDIIIKMVKEASFADNYAYFDKNRYTKIPIENIRYNIAKGTVYNPNAPEVESAVALGPKTRVMIS